MICTAAGDRNIIAKFNRFRCRKRNVFLFFIYRQRQLNRLVVFYDDLQVIITQFQLISLDGNGALIGINGVIRTLYQRGQRAGALIQVYLSLIVVLQLVQICGYIAAGSKQRNILTFTDRGNAIESGIFVFNNRNQIRCSPRGSLAERGGLAEQIIFQYLLYRIGTVRRGFCIFACGIFCKGEKLILGAGLICCIKEAGAGVNLFCTFIID